MSTSQGSSFWQSLNLNRLVTHRKYVVPNHCLEGFSFVQPSSFLKSPFPLKLSRWSPWLNVLLLSKDPFIVRVKYSSVWDLASNEVRKHDAWRILYLAPSLPSFDPPKTHVAFVLFHVRSSFTTCFLGLAHAPLPLCPKKLANTRPSVLQSRSAAGLLCKPLVLQCLHARKARKQVCPAVAWIDDPTILILREPTNTLKELATKQTLACKQN